MNFPPVSFFLPPGAKDSVKDQMQARLVIKASLLTSLFSFTYLLLSWWINFDMGVYLMAFNVAAFLLLPFLLRAGVPTLSIGNLYVLAGTLAVVILVLFSGGMQSAILPWLIFVPAISLLLITTRWAIVWTAVVLMVITVITYSEWQGRQFPVAYDTSWSVLFNWLCITGIVVIVFVIIRVFERNRNSAVKELNVKNEELQTTLQKLKLAQAALEEINANVQASNDELLAQTEQIAEQSNHLQSLNEQKDYIIEVLSHDLKAPLHSIEGLLAVLSAEELSDAQVECLQLIRQSNQQAQRLIRKVLEVGEAGTREMKLEWETLLLSEVLQEVIDDYRAKAEAKEIALWTDWDNTVELKADRIYLRQIMDNLISNALKFSPRNSQVVVRQLVQNNQVRIEVQDQGPGIPPEDQLKLFGKYNRLTAKPTAGESSTGLGLSLVKRYVEMLGGQVYCSSKPGQGATFIVEFSINQNHE